MIEQVEITSLKCFQSLRLSVKPFNLLAGLNSAGKSTVIQAFLLSELARRGTGRVPLTGEFGLSMGDALDVLNRDAQDRIITVAMSGPSASITCHLGVPESDGALTLDVLPDSQWTPGQGRVAAYLCAERLGPRDALEMSADPQEQVSVGHQGQYTAQVLAELDRMVVDDMRRVPSEVAIPPTLSSQSEAWLSRIVRPIQVEATRVVGTSLATLRFREPTRGADWVRPANVGFGLSYALPIIVAGLTARADEFCIVENPEAHLHPAGQSRMGEFLARLAASGVQVIVETHSDHVINGVRRAVVTEQVIPADDVAINFFGENADVTHIGVTDLGGLTSWPDFFFDQVERDLTAISRSATTR